MKKQYTLQYIGKAGDVIARDYFNTLEQLTIFADGLIDTYINFGNENTYALFISMPDGNEEMYWEYDGEVDEEE